MSTKSPAPPQPPSQTPPVTPLPASLQSPTEPPKESLSIDNPIRLMRQMSHDMRTPLSALIATSDMLAEGGYDALTPKQTRAVDRIQRNSRRLLAILDDLMTYVKAEANQYVLDVAPFNPRTLLTESLDQVRPAAEQKGLTLASIYKDALPANLTGDQANIKRIVLALLWNAIAATTQGTITLDADWSTDQPPQWVVRVRDTGCGIATDEVPHLFEPFWRGNDRSQVQTSGCGLGLPMARSLAHLMQGKLTLESTSPQGSAFLLQLPLAVAPT